MKSEVFKRNWRKANLKQKLEFNKRLELIKCEMADCDYVYLLHNIMDIEVRSDI